MASGRVSVRLNRAGIARVTNVRMVRIGNSVLNSSRRRVNVDTGNLRSTGAMEDRGEIVRVAYRARYARWVHDGTRWYRGNPYLTGAVKEVLARYGRRRSS